MAKVLNRVGQFYLDLTKAAIDAAAPWLDGFVIWGRRGLQKGDLHALRPPAQLLQAVGQGHRRPTPTPAGIDVIYHGCGNVGAIFADFIEIGVDAYNPLEVKAGMDAGSICGGAYGHRIGFCGNSDIQVWKKGDREAIRREVLRKLNAARAGGFIFQSDHSVSSAVSGRTYDEIVKLVAASPLPVSSWASSTKPSEGLRTCPKIQNTSPFFCCPLTVLG